MPYSVPEVARAVEVPNRALEAWLEAGVLRASHPATGRGTRHKFERSDVLRVAIVAEVHRVLGGRLRPGGLAAMIAGLAGRLGWRRSGTAFDHRADAMAVLIDEVDAARQALRQPVPRLRWLLVTRGRERRPAIDLVADDPLGRGPVTLVIDLLHLWLEVEARLP
jgi:hypothetical protein